jgi:predicted dehydrogenase
LGQVLMGSVLHSSALTGDPAGLSPWRGRRGLAAGGILTTQAIHFLDLLLWFAGPVRAVKAWTATLARHEQEYEDTAALALKLRSGALATLVATNGAPIEDDFTGTRVEIHGREGHIMLEGDRLRLASTRPGYELPTIRLPPVAEGADDVVFGVGHVHEIIDFVRAIRRGDPPPVPAGDGRHLMAVLSAAYASAGEDREIQIDERLLAYSGSSHEGSLLVRKGPVCEYPLRDRASMSP